MTERHSSNKSGEEFTTGSLRHRFCQTNNERRGRPFRGSPFATIRYADTPRPSPGTERSVGPSRTAKTEVRWEAYDTHRLDHIGYQGWTMAEGSWDVSARVQDIAEKMERALFPG